MKKGFFRAGSFLILAALLTLPSCANLLTALNTESNDPSELDRDYATEESRDEDGCTGRYCRSAGNNSDNGGRELASISDKDSRLQRAIDSRDVILGMTRQDVTASWGEPRQREIAGRGQTGNERWTYGTSYSLDGARTVIFENGRVAGWER